MGIRGIGKTVEAGIASRLFFCFIGEPVLDRSQAAMCNFTLGKPSTFQCVQPPHCHSERSEESRILKVWNVSSSQDFRPFATLRVTLHWGKGLTFTVPQLLRRGVYRAGVGVLARMRTLWIRRPSTEVISITRVSVSTMSPRWGIRPRLM